MAERSLGFVKAIQFTLPWETGKDKDGNLRADGGLIVDQGGLTKYGISSNANPGVDIKNLTVETATEIYKTKYWDIYVSIRPVSANLDNLPVALAVAVFDAGVNCGVGHGIKWLGRGLESKNPTKTVNDLRGAYYFDLVSQDRIKYGNDYKGWMARLTDLKKYCDVIEQEAQNNAEVLDKIKAAGRLGFGPPA